ncbi:translation initiation factor IF-2 [Bubalus bubalis]|uniref:translation initiation factor IF-2 n=1 Tax=Bubalus bubalis TaxID=89462 RepID=UPI001E1B796E|nr:translation initiation factor IF-2 [Bubalus bubalis]
MVGCREEKRVLFSRRRAPGGRWGLRAQVLRDSERRGGIQIQSPLPVPGAHRGRPRPGSPAAPGEAARLSHPTVPRAPRGTRRRLLRVSRGGGGPGARAGELPGGGRVTLRVSPGARGRRPARRGAWVAGRHIRKAGPKLGGSEKQARTFKQPSHECTPSRLLHRRFDSVPSISPFSMSTRQMLLM